MLSLRGVDRTLFLLTLCLLMAGLVVLYAASAQPGLPGGAGGGVLVRRLVQIALGGACLLAAALCDLRLIRRAAPYAALISAGLLLWVLTMPMIKGTRGWLSLGGFSIQPVDVARVALMLFMAERLATHEELPGWRRFKWPAIALGVGVLLVAVQPDFGSALALGLSGAGLLVAARLPWRWLGAALLLAALLAGSLYLASDRVRHRIDLTRHFDTETNSAENYQLRQSLIGIGAGGPLGQGAGRNRQRIFLPDHHTDFIFAIAGEEYGFVGATLLLSLLTALSLRILRVARRQADPFARYLAAGLGGMIAVYTGINLAVALGLFPLTGVPLPFISHGGSALVMNMLAIGLVLAVSREEPLRVAQARRRRLFSRGRVAEPIAEDLFGRGLQRARRLPAEPR